MEGSSNVKCEIVPFSESNQEREISTCDATKSFWQMDEEKPFLECTNLTDDDGDDDGFDFSHDKVNIPTDMILDEATVDGSDVKPRIKSDLTATRCSTAEKCSVAANSGFSEICVKEEPTESYPGEVDISFEMGGRSYSTSEHHKVNMNEDYNPEDSIHEYVCVTCNEVFSTCGDLEDHTVSHGSGTLPAQMSRETLPVSDHLQRHFLIHKGIRHFKCEVCLKRFSSRPALRLHLKIHDKHRTFHCGICEQRFRRIGYLKDHMLGHQSEKAFSCGLCGKRFSFARRLKCHMICHIQNRPYKCRLCRKTFKTECVRKKHELGHSAGNKSQCDICNKFVTSLANHMRVHTFDESYVCAICEKSFHSKSRLAEHKKIHIGARPWQCNECWQEFKTMSGLKQHIYRIHAAEKSYQCSVCEKAFSRESFLNEHFRRSHVAKICSFVCGVCNKEYNSKQGLRYHVSSHKSGRSFWCKICKKLCFTQKQLDGHLARHATVVKKDTVDKDVENGLPACEDQWETGVCILCEKSCKTDSKLSVHMRSRHPGQKPFKCHQCDQAFLVHQHLRLHTVKKH